MKNSPGPFRSPPMLKYKEKKPFFLILNPVLPPFLPLEVEPFKSS